MKLQRLHKEVLRTTGIFKGTHRPVIHMRFSKFRTCMILSENYAARNQKSYEMGEGKFSHHLATRFSTYSARLLGPEAEWWQWSFYNPVKRYGVRCVWHKLSQMRRYMLCKVSSDKSLVHVTYSMSISLRHLYQTPSHLTQDSLVLSSQKTS
jgi:hypothetical protein